jgi:hypothetical protein
MVWPIWLEISQDLSAPQNVKKPYPKHGLLCCDTGKNGETGMDKVTAGNEPSFIERRHNARLRSIFPDARIRIAHFFHGSHDWVDSSVEYLARRVVHESYPDLNTAEVRILITAIERRVADGVRRYLTLEATP